MRIYLSCLESGRTTSSSSPSSMLSSSIFMLTSSISIDIFIEITFLGAFYEVESTVSGSVSVVDDVDVATKTRDPR